MKSLCVVYINIYIYDIYDLYNFYNYISFENKENLYTKKLILTDIYWVNE